MYDGEEPSALRVPLLFTKVRHISLAVFPQNKFITFSFSTIAFQDVLEGNDIHTKEVLLITFAFLRPQNMEDTMMVPSQLDTCMVQNTKFTLTPSPTAASLIMKSLVLCVTFKPEVPR